MNKAKFISRKNVTIVDENDQSHPIDGEQSENQDALCPEVKVVNEPLSTHSLVRWLTFVKSRFIFLMSIALAMLTGYLIAWLNFRTNDVQLNDIQSQMEERVIESTLPTAALEIVARYYASLTNIELRECSLNFVAQLRKFLLNWGVRENQLVLSLRNKLDAAVSEGERQEVWNHYISNSKVTFEARTLEYEKYFMTEAIQLRNELLSRMPDLKRNNTGEYFYQKPDNPADMRKVLDDITFLTESLLSQ